MTLTAIMKDDSQPRLQMAAAKLLLEKGRAAQPAGELPNTIMPDEDEVNAAIALAKKLLDELARSKTQKLDGAGGMAAEGKAGADHA